MVVLEKCETVLNFLQGSVPSTQTQLFQEKLPYKYTNTHLVSEIFLQSLTLILHYNSVLENR